MRKDIGTHVCKHRLRFVTQFDIWDCTRVGIKKKKKSLYAQLGEVDITTLQSIRTGIDKLK